MRVRRVVTTRAGGRSTGPFARFNLSVGVGDDPLAVAANRRRLATELGVRGVVFLDQVHGTGVAVVDAVPGPRDRDRPASDAAVTALPGVALAVLTADCVPVLLADTTAGIAAVAHAGRKGMVAGVARAAAEAMMALGATDIVARLGPSVCPRCYPVPLELREQAAQVHAETRSVDRFGAPAIDVAAGVLAQLAPLCSSVQQVPGCTAEHPDLYSYRRDGVTGRFAGAVVLQAA